ncbi:MAG: hypothetical protein H5U00_11835, partial [Clostridia bacterium]|nr:hypothetical protein [Clostridia bacterium]
MAGNLLGAFFSLLERQEQGRIPPEQLAGLLSLYTLLNIVDYLQRGAGQAARLPAETAGLKATEPTLQKALTAVLGNTGVEEAGQALAGLAKSLGKNPAAVMHLVNLLAG